MIGDKVHSRLFRRGRRYSSLGCLGSSAVIRRRGPPCRYPRYSNPGRYPSVYNWHPRCSSSSNQGWKMKPARQDLVLQQVKKTTSHLLLSAGCQVLGAGCCKSRRWSPYTWKPFIFLVSCSPCAGGLITNIFYPDTTSNPGSAIKKLKSGQSIYHEMQKMMISVA